MLLSLFKSNGKGTGKFLKNYAIFAFIYLKYEVKAVPQTQHAGCKEKW